MVLLTRSKQGMKKRVSSSLKGNGLGIPPLPSQCHVGVRFERYLPMKCHQHGHSFRSVSNEWVVKRCSCLPSSWLRSVIEMAESEKPIDANGRLSTDLSGV